MILPILAVLSLTPQAPELAIVNAKIWTDGKIQKADCLMVANGRITFLGGLTGLRLNKSTKVIDAKGQVVIPGIIDSHTHLMEGGVGLIDQLDLRGAKSKADFIRMIREFSAKLPPGRWVRGHSWSAESWPEKEQPTKEWIDEATGGRPAILDRMDGHSILVNSEALRLAKIDKDSPKDPPGGVIDRDAATGEPTGILRENAAGLVSPPAPSQEDQFRGFMEAVKLANRFGVTGSSDIGSPGRIFLYQRYARGSAPTFRIGFYSDTSSWPLAFQALSLAEKVPGWFVPNGVKAYMDGSLGSRTAYMHEPFTTPLPHQAKDWRGVPMPGATNGTYKTQFAEAAKRKLQIIVHAIGDQANHDVLDLFAGIDGVKSRRFRVEHVQHLLPVDYGRFAQLGVIPSMQPYHKADDGRYCEEVIGRTRSESSYAFRSLLGHKALLAFGSDWPVVTSNPWEGISAAVTGKILTGKVWMPHQSISIHQALDAYTRSSAYAMFMEKEIGSLTPGHRADIVILDRDPFRAGTDLAKVKPKSLWVDGRKVY
jgi:predicted amidohydrolase YtcJ